MEFVICFALILLKTGEAQSIVPTVATTDGTVGELNGTKASTSTIYPLPEIKIKLADGTSLPVESNSPVVLPQRLQFVELSCTADFPVKWEYLVNNKTIPLLDVMYRRLVRNFSEFSNPKGNRFISLVKLRGLLESQTGKYLCRHYNEKLNNNSYAISSYFDIFVPGNKTFNAISSVGFANRSASHINIQCPVTNPEVHVRLYKLNEKHYMKTRSLSWKPIYAHYEPTDGFRLLAGLGRELLGTYNCSADNGASVILDVADLSERELYISSSPTLNGSSCWENFNFVRYLRSKRLECFCRDSFGLFMNENFEFENRRAQCSIEGILTRLENCSDWRLNEYFLSPEGSPDLCFHEPTTWAWAHGEREDDRSGSRPSLRVSGKTFDGDDTQNKLAFTSLNITYNGFVDWAGDFMLAICRSEECHQDFNADGTRRSGSGNNGSEKLEYIEIEPSSTQYFPLAHNQVKWENVYITGTGVKRVYVFQASSLSYAWFPFATTQIQWNNDSSPPPPPPLAPEVGFPEKKIMSEVESQSSSSTPQPVFLFKASASCSDNYTLLIYLGFLCWISFDL